MPSLKPFTAPPRSLPRLRSFLVPNTRTTTSRTISQCQILNDPISSPYIRCDPVWNHAGQAFPASYDMKMQMMNFLPPYASGIDNGAEAVAATLFESESGYQYHHIPK